MLKKERRKAKTTCPTNFPVIIWYSANQEHIHSEVISRYRFPKRTCNAGLILPLISNFLVSSVIPEVLRASFLIISLN